MDPASIERSTFFGDTLFEVVVIPFLADTIRMWLEPGSSGPVLMVEESGRLHEVMKWDDATDAWVPGDSLDEEKDSERPHVGDERVREFLATVDEAFAEAEDPRADRLAEAIAEIVVAVGDLVSGGWRVQTVIGTRESDLTLTLTAMPPNDVRRGAGDAVASWWGAKVGPVELRWRSQDPSAMAASWLLESASLGQEPLAVESTLGALAEVVAVAAPAWTLRAGADEPVERHSAGGAMRPASVTVDHDSPEVSPEQVAEAKAKVAAWGDEYDFGEMIAPPTVSAVNVVLDAAGEGTAGYYLLEFDNGDCYVGQSTSIGTRLASHLLDRPGLVSIRLRPDLIASRLSAQLTHLLQHERALIHAAQRAQLSMRNKAEMTFRAGHSSLDDAFAGQSVTVQEWLTDPIGVNGGLRECTPRRVLDQSEIASGREALEVMKGRAGDRFDDLIAVQRTYVQRCLPLPSVTEAVWWVVSSPIKTPRHRTLSNLSVGWGEEALRINVDLSGWIQVNGSELLGDDYDDESVVRFMRQHPGVWLDDAPYVDAGPFNLNVRAPNLDVLTDLLDDTRVTRAAATAALGLMRARKTGAARTSHNAVLSGMLLS